MKIIYVFDSISRIGGTERILSEKMNYLVEKYGYDIYLITSNQGTHPFSFPLSCKITHIDLNVPFHHQYKYKYPFRLLKKLIYNTAFIKRLQYEVKRIKSDIVIGTTYWKGEVICNLKCDAKIIIESHNARPFTGINDGSKRNRITTSSYQYLLQKWQKKIERKCDALITLTNGDAKEWNNAKCVRVIPNMTQPLLQDSPAILKKKKHVISVGRLSHQKGFDCLIDAWKSVYQKYPDWKLDIYGDNGDLKPEIEKQIQNLNLANVITLHNPTNQIFSKYQESEFYVMSSRYEGWGLVLVEAMSCGIPCIAFDCPYGPSDIIENGKNGILVKNGDIQGMADAICWMIEHEEERIQMGISARETSKKYRPEVIMKQWDELFKELVKQ